ncbi:BspA family leucine-rich repeat surface protein [Gallibacterium salpingitidis]|uniref:hypothetical protein n=1 Tax=Gallibacterium salpingitidis TaxID=505341 RepID=UPI00266FA2E8|nr:hypothetical protein [Gallibacterium salpingitidis]WKT00937.1 BspA family leucine-rich repeat surface protein [Gallibacterium salpingitidis]
MSLKQNLERIKLTKDELRQALISKNIDMTGVTFEQYPNKIQALNTGNITNVIIDPDSDIPINEQMLALNAEYEKLPVNTKTFVVRLVPTKPETISSVFDVVLPQSKKKVVINFVADSDEVSFQSNSLDVTFDAQRPLRPSNVIFTSTVNGGVKGLLNGCVCDKLTISLFGYDTNCDAILKNTSIKTFEGLGCYIDVLLAFTSSAVSAFENTNARTIKNVYFDFTQDFDATKMFFNCKALDYFSNCRISDVNNASYMFAGCTSLKDIRLDSNINFGSQCKNFSHTFDGCTSLIRVRVDASSATSFDNMFNGCSKLEVVELKGARVSFSVANTSMSSDDLNKMFGTLATVTDYPTITITNTPGAEACDKSIAINKGWRIIN